MTLVKFRPSRSMCATPSNLEQIFDSFFTDSWPGFGQEFGGWAPQVDVEETDDAIVLHADLPGVNKADISISVEDGTLTLRGERKHESDENTLRFRRVERTYGSFRRSFTLPAHVLADKVEATFKNGVLEVSVPKAEVAKPRTIAIKG